MKSIKSFNKIFNTSQFRAGAAWSETISNAYLVSKGVRDLALCYLWGANVVIILQQLKDYTKVFKKSASSRSISFKILKLNSSEKVILIFAKEAKYKAESLIKLLKAKDEDPNYHEKMGLLLGYRPDLVKAFVQSYYG